MASDTDMKQGQADMGVHFVPEGETALVQLWARASGEIALACDGRGRITEVAGTRTPGILGRPLWTLAHPGQREAIRRAFAAALRDKRRSPWLELTISAPGQPDDWFELRIDPATLGPNHARGAVCVLRSIAERLRLEQKAFAAALTDPLTGLTNRTAFLAMLAHLAEQGMPGCLALIDLDRFRTFNLRHGHAAGDRLLVSFAELLRHLTGPEHILSRIDGEIFAVIMPGMDMAASRTTAEAIPRALTELAIGLKDRELPFTASIGLAALGPDSDATLRIAELAVTEAKARGRARVATWPSWRPRIWRRAG